MVTFEEIIQEKDKTKRDQLIKNKLDELNATTEPVYVDTEHNVTGFISNRSKVEVSNTIWGIDDNVYNEEYSMKADDYFYEFFDFLIEHNITTKSDAITHISSFLKSYFNVRGGAKHDRDSVFEYLHEYLKDFYKKYPDKFNWENNNALDIGSFKNLSAAECCEHACTGQNLLTICDVESCYVVGKLSVLGKAPECHAYNIIKYNNEFFLLDISNPANLYEVRDHHYEFVGCNSPLIRISRNDLIEFMSGKSKLETHLLEYVRVPNSEKNKLISCKECIYTATGKPLNKEALDEFCSGEAKAI